jgi:hypothetical protein
LHLAFLPYALYSRHYSRKSVWVASGHIFNHQFLESPSWTLASEARTLPESRTPWTHCHQHESESVRCFSRLDGPWQSDGIDDSEPRTSVSCYRTQSLIHEADGGIEAVDGKELPEADKVTNPFVIRVQKTTSLSSEPRMSNKTTTRNP